MTVEASAKINRTLEVYAKRSDGFHALRSIVQPITLADTLHFERDTSFSTDTGYPDDLILKAARLLWDGVRQPYRICVTKRIPAGGGLGGGSADAAATLRALNALWNLGKTPEELAALGAAVGSDVPALVLAQHYGRCVLMEGRGERVTVCETPVGQHIVLANPGVNASTKDVYAHCTPRTTPAHCFVNDLQDAACTLYPEIARTLNDLRDVGARDVMMSGSGATAFGFADSAVQATRLAALLTERGYRTAIAMGLDRPAPRLTE